MVEPAASAASAALCAAHWRNFIYRSTARHWHALWCRWGPDGSLRTAFTAERCFTPAADGCDMQVTYHYRDERGTVREGPACGPWRITEGAHSQPDGLQHPSSAEMTTLLLPAGGPSAWCAKQAGPGKPCATELFLHHGEHLRMSAGVIHAADGSLVQLALIREDARGPWPSSGWGDSESAAPSSGAALAAALARDGAATEAHGVGHAITADLQQRPLSGDWSATRIATASPTDDVLLLCEDRVAIVAPVRRPDGVPFSSAAAWWPQDGGGALYTIEACWDATGAVSEVRYLVFSATPEGQA